MGQTECFVGCNTSIWTPRGDSRCRRGSERACFAQSNGCVVITIDTQSRCLTLYPLPEWERIEADIQSLPALNPAVKRFQRLMLGYAADIELDGSGRVLLPQSLRDYAQLEKKVVLVGQGNKMELWSEEQWLVEQQAALSVASGAELPAELLSLTL